MFLVIIAGINFNFIVNVQLKETGLQVAFANLGRIVKQKNHDNENTNGGLIT